MKPVRTTSDGTRWVNASISVPEDLYNMAKALKVPFASTFREALAVKIEDRKRAVTGNPKPATVRHPVEGGNTG